MAFNFKGSLRANAGPCLKSVIVDNSDVVEFGDAVKVYNAGDAELATAGKPIFGFVHAIVDKYGLSLAPQRNSKATLGSASIDSTGLIVTVASDNETVDQIKVVCDVSLDSIYSGLVTGTINTTVSSSKPGISVDIDDENSIDETTASRTATAQLYGWGADPADSTRMLVSIKESERTGTLTY